MKKVLSTLAIAALLSPVAANANQFTGWSAGFNFGIMDGIAKITDDTYYVTPTSTVGYSEYHTGRYGRSAGIIGLNLGYAGCFNPCWNWGIEGRANFSNLKTGRDHVLFASNSSGTHSTHAEAKLDQQYGIVAKVGYLVNKCSQIYAFVGPQWGDFKHNGTGYQSISVGTAQPTIYVANTSHDHSKFKTGLLAGLGVEQMWNDCVGVALEYDYGNYGSVSGSSNGHYFANSVAVANTQFNRNSTAKFITNSMVLKFNYYFC